MKGTVHKCIEKLITENFGYEKWQACLQGVGLDEDHVFMMNDDVDEALTMKLVTEVIPAVCNLSVQQVLDAFGQYWVNNYTSKLYAPYYEGCHSAKDLLMKLNFIHQSLTDKIPNARPPRLSYEWVNDKTLSLTYMSDRGLIDLFISIGKGLGTYFKEDLKITKKSNQTMEVVFS